MTAMDPNPYQSPTTTSGADRRGTFLVSTSVVETFAAAAIVALVYSMASPDMRNSPRIAEWFGWAPGTLASVLFFATALPFLAVPLTVMAFIPQVGLSKKFRETFPVTFTRRGSPPLLGAFIRMSGVVLFFVLIFLLSQLED